ncbi:hypothetical protein J4212_05000 [Candidatus Woesearchaeota archaeon]|nr:hypothetical protein [Candidatus Woesearchaeota archaeon]
MTMKEELESIKERNKRVEADKAWELSRTRRASIAIMTYFVIAVFLMMIEIPKPWFSALVPSIGFYLSTLTLPFLKRAWLRKIYRS